MSEASPVPESPAKPRRLEALDAFRGITVVGMLMVNNAAMGDATPDALRHADWGSITAADLVFPWFLLIVGVALPFSAGKAGGWPFVRRALARTGWLLLLGMFVDSAVARRVTVGLGVLQLIGLAYFVGALSIRLPVWARSLGAALLLIGHHMVLRFVAVPGVESGTISESVNAVRHLNDNVFGPLGLRGLPSVLPTSGMVLLGSVIGSRLQQNYGSRWRQALELVAIGLSLIAVGWLWSHALPLSKSIWTSSYIVLTAGIGLGLLGVMLGLIADRSRWAWPLVAAGANPIVAYVAPILVKTLVLQEWRMATTDVTIERGLQDAAYAAFGRTQGGWAYTLGYAAVWWMVLATMAYRRIYVRV